MWSKIRTLNGSYRIFPSEIGRRKIYSAQLSWDDSSRMRTLLLILNPECFHDTRFRAKASLLVSAGGTPPGLSRGRAGDRSSGDCSMRLLCLPNCYANVG